MDRFPNLPVLKHVYGHQDRDLTYDELPLGDAKMNTEADALATMEHDEFSTTLHRAPFDPESKVRLSIDGITVTRRLESTIRTSTAPLPSLITYYLERLHWDQFTFKSVDWATFGSVYVQSKQRNFITKFCFYTLPTGDHLHPRNSSYDNRCPTCHTPNETDDHLLQCPSQARSVWRSDLIWSLLKPRHRLLS